MLYVARSLFLASILYWVLGILPTETDPLFFNARFYISIFDSGWDVPFYVQIAQQGYKVAGVEHPSVVFFPLLPLLMRLVAPLVGEYVVAGLLITNGALLLATLLLYQLVENEWGAEIAKRSVWYLLIFPTSFYGSTVYTESLFLLFAVGALYAARQQRWWIVGACGVLVSATRPTGIFVAVLLFVEWWMQQRQAKRRDWAGVCAAGVSPLGLVGYMGYLWAVFGDPLLFVTAQAEFGRITESTWATTANSFLRPQSADLIGASVHNWIDLLFTITFVIIGCVLARQKRYSEAVFVLMGALLPVLLTGSLVSQRRYVWILFPAFVQLARWGKRAWVDWLLTIIFLVGFVVFSTLIVLGYWVA